MGDSEPAARRYNDLAGRRPDRLAGISDGIFSVGMTLLVLGLAVPALRSGATELDLWRAVGNLGPSLVIYTMSFMTLGIFWVGQQTQISQLARSDRHYTWIQLGFLFSVTLVPFSTQLLAHYPTLRVALVEYWLNIALLGGMLLVALEYGLRSDLFEDGMKGSQARLIRGRVLIAQLLYAIAVALSIVLPTYVSIALIVLIQVNYVTAPPIPFLSRY